MYRINSLLTKLNKSIGGLALSATMIVAGTLNLLGQFTPPPKTAVRESARVITIKLDQLQVRDEDDSFTNDELYVIMTRFRMRAMIRDSDGKMVAEPGTLSVRTDMASRYDLGLGRENWADEGHTYDIPAGVPSAVREVFPGGEPNWVAGAVVTTMEWDSFSPSTVALLAQRIEDLVRGTLNGADLGRSELKAVTNDVTHKVMTDFALDLSHMNLGAAIFDVITAADPDDFGGFQIVMAQTLPRNAVAFYSGPPISSLEEAARYLHFVSTSARFQMGFPYGLGRDIPWNGRYTGNSIFHGTVAVAPLSF